MSAPTQLFGDAAVRRVLKEDTTVDLALIQVRRLVTSVGNIGCSSGLLEYAELELATSDKIDSLVGHNL